MKRFNTDELIKAVNGKLIFGNKKNSFDEVCTDSRLAQSGDVFFAIVGENNDAHSYLGQVIERGCHTLVVSDESKVPTEFFPEKKGKVDVVLVEDTTKALQDFSKFYLASLPINKKIAVTGSVGKTTTRDMLYYIASKKYKTGRNVKNFNNGFGLPLSVLGFDDDTEVAVLEMGMSDKGQISKLAELVRPDIAVITNIGISHIENLGTREGILSAKMEVTDYFDDDSTLIVNSDNDMLSIKNVSGKYNLITVGTNGNEDYVVSDICDFGDKGIEYKLSHKNSKYNVKLNVPGAHNALNATLAIAAGNLIGIDIKTAIEGLKKVELTEKRLSIKESNGIKIIDDTYNACLDSMKSAIDTLMATELSNNGRHIAILGDMFELGEESEKAHLDVGKYAVDKGVDLLIAVGNEAKYYVESALLGIDIENVLYYEDKESLLTEIGSLIKPNDVVLIKASRGMNMEKIVKELLENNECKLSEK